MRRLEFFVILSSSEGCNLVSTIVEISEDMILFMRREDDWLEVG